MSKADEIKIKEDEDKIIYYIESRTDTEIYKFAIFKQASDKKFRLKIYEQYCDIGLFKIIHEELKKLGWLDE